MTGAPSALVRLAGVGMRFGGGPPVLSGVEAAVRPGEFVGVIGPSGCGKSTLLRLVAGLVSPTEGSVLIGGRPPAQARRELFFVFQDPTLLPWRRVAANVELPLLLEGRPREERRRRMREMLDLVGLEADSRKYPWQLSGGMKMRVSIARALSLSPRLLLLDEPFAALDEMTRDRLDEDLVRLHQRDGFTALFVTHSVAEAVFLSSRILVLAANPGRIAAEIDIPFARPRTAELREDPAYLRLLAEISRILRAATAEGGRR